MPRAQSPTVFLSHSHRDRQVATLLQKVLETNGARTYLDQDKIQAGDKLPARISKGIESSDTLLLVWSASASTSKWVRREWELARQFSKKIVPYLLDATALPSALEDRVFLEVDDQTHAHAGLLKAVFGRAFVPASRTALFPGWWRADVEIAGIGRATYQFELRMNGQLAGSAQEQQSGLLGDLVNQAGVGSLLNTSIPVHGDWTYEDVADLLTITMTATGFGTANTETIRIKAASRDREAILGRDLGGRTWTLTRLNDPGREEDDSFDELERSLQREAEVEGREPTGQGQPSTATLRKELRRQYDLLGPVGDPGRKAKEFVFLGTIGYALVTLGLSEDDFHEMIGADNILLGTVSDDLLQWLTDEGWLSGA